MNDWRKKRISLKKRKKAWKIRKKTKNGRQEGMINGKRKERAKRTNEQKKEEQEKERKEVMEEWEKRMNEEIGKWEKEKQRNKKGLGDWRKKHEK